MADKRPQRSDKYQYLICEILLSSEAWNTFGQAQEKNLPLAEEKREILLDWDAELKVHLMKMIDQCLTERQRDILLMYCSGMTQTEIADKLDINQSSVTKSINGNVDYTNGKHVYGGLKKKFVKIIKRNFDIRPTMKKIHLVWEPNSCRLPHYQTFRSLLGTEDEFEAWLDETPEEFKRKIHNDDHRHTKLTQEQILQIRELRSQGHSIHKLQKQFHISGDRVRDILDGDK